MSFHAEGGNVVVFDVLSHATMHLQFNEAYVRLVHAAFPKKRCVFFARSEHLHSLAPLVDDLDRIELRPCEPLTIPFGLSRHNPVAGRWAAQKVFKDVKKATRNVASVLVSILGVDANLYAVFRDRWSESSDAPLHLILHSQLGDSMAWRSRNPLVRKGDFVTAIGRSLPTNVTLVALELGVKEAIGAISARLIPNIITLEHPILESEWITAHRLPAEGKLRIGFLGHSSRTKGFDIFADMARAYRSADRRFEAIGIWAPNTDTLDLSGLDRVPAHDGLSREAYLRALADVDLVCLPLSSRAYDFVASGCVSDAIAGLKPLVALRTRSLAAIWDRYGPIGHLANDNDELRTFIGTFSNHDFVQCYPRWVTNLTKLRSARLPTMLASDYRASVPATIP